MMRLRKRSLCQVTCKKTAAYVDTTGGIARLETPQGFHFSGLRLPPQKRVTRTPSGIRLALTWKLIPKGSPAVSERDRLYFEDDPRCFVVTAVQVYPRHVAYHLELSQ
ncbi:MAG: hypothetical protein GXZ04_06960 [Clostridiales bacterium]|nr:hypothetical protein [Clostridiales bacterium]